MLIIAFATKNTPYEKVINEGLIPSLQKFNISYDIVYPSDKGSWLENEKLKPTIIKEMLLKHKCSLTYVDADATIERYPELLDQLQDYDIGAHYFDWYKFWRNKEGMDKREILGGTLYFNYNEKILAFVDEWIKMDMDDMQSLAIVLPKWYDRLKVYSLPIEYCAICKTDRVPTWIINPVIVHHQASRKFKNWRSK
jgi:hypothetical protein